MTATNINNLVGPEGERFLHKINTLADCSPSRSLRILSYGLATKRTRKTTSFHASGWTQRLISALQMVSAAELPHEFQGSTAAAAALNDFVGEYQFDFGILDVELNRDHLEAQLTGQPPFPIFAGTGDKFFYKAVDAQLDFERDTEGKIVAVVLYQNGRVIRGLRTASQR